jgi:DNA-binding response OmpR family regulator
MTSRRLLIVEDSAELAENLAEIVSEGDFDTCVAHSAEQALNLLARVEFDVILTDLRLPNQSGVDLIQCLRDDGNETPVVLMSAFADEAAQTAARRLGVVTILIKPIDCTRLLSELDASSDSSQDLRPTLLRRKD